MLSQVDREVDVSLLFLLRVLVVILLTSRGSPT
jgi:hypothetical protein